MTIELPDEIPAKSLTREELRAEPARVLYVRGRLGKVSASPLAGLEFFSFQRALAERNVSMHTQSMLADDLKTLNRVFPS